MKKKTCPYCHTLVEETEDQKWFNGLKPIFNHGCEFCDPTSEINFLATTSEGMENRTLSIGDEYFIWDDNYTDPVEKIWFGTKEDYALLAQSEIFVVIGGISTYVR